MKGGLALRQHGREEREHSIVGARGMSTDGAALIERHEQLCS